MASKHLVLGLFALTSAALAQDGPTGTIDRWIAGLGSGEWQVREDSVRRLVGAGEAARAALVEAVESDDPEVAGRARRVLDWLDHPLDYQRAQDATCYSKLEAAWRAAHRGRWVVLAGGEQVALEDDLDRALEAARPTTRECLHRFVFRVGEDASEETFWEPHGSTRLLDVGALFFQDLPRDVSILQGARQVIVRKGDVQRVFDARPGGEREPRFPLTLSSLEPDGNAATLDLTCFVNSGLEGALLLSQADAVRLGLFRHEIPGRAMDGLRIDLGREAPHGYACVRAGAAIPEVGQGPFPVRVHVSSD